MSNLDKLNKILAEQQERACEIFGEDNILQAINNANQETAKKNQRDCEKKLRKSIGRKASHPPEITE